MKDQANRREQASIYLLIATGIFLWISMLFAAFEIWSWILSALYAMSAGLLSSCIFQERNVLKGILLFGVLEVLQFVLCGAVAFSTRALF